MANNPIKNIQDAIDEFISEYDNVTEELEECRQRISQLEDEVSSLTSDLIDARMELFNNQTESQRR